MIRKVFSFTPEKSNHSHNEENTFIISFTNNGFIFFICSKHPKRIFKIEEYVFEPQKPELNNFINEFIAFSNDYLNNLNHIKNIYNISQSNKYTIIPKELFEESSISKYLDFLYGKNTYENIKIDKIEFYNSVLLSEPIDWQKDFICKLNTSIINNNDIYVFIKAIFELNISKGVFINVNTKYFDVLILHNNNLKLVNRFEFENAKDFCYYVVGAIKMLKLNTYEETIFLAGDILPVSEIVNLLSKFVSEIKFLAPKNLEIPNNLPIHRYFNQLSIL